MRMGCGASMGGRAQPDPGVSPKSDSSRAHPRLYPANNHHNRRPHSNHLHGNGETGSPGEARHGSPLASTNTQPHLAQRRVAGAARVDPPPDALGQICVPVKDAADGAAAAAGSHRTGGSGGATYYGDGRGPGVSNGTSATERSSSRLSFAQLRPVTISHSALIAVQAPSPSGGYAQNRISSGERDAEGKRTSSSLFALPQQQQQQQEQQLSPSSAQQARDDGAERSHRPPGGSSSSPNSNYNKGEGHEDEESEQHRLCEQSLVRSTSLLDLMNSLSSSSHHATRQDQPFPAAEMAGRLSPSAAGAKLRSPTSMQEPAPPPPQLPSSSSSSPRPTSAAYPHQPTLQQGRPRRSDTSAGSARAITTSYQSLPSGAPSTVMPRPVSGESSAEAAATSVGTAAPAAAASGVVTVDTVDTSGLDVEYLDNGSNFDIDSTDEDSEDGDSISAEQLHIALSATAPGRGSADFTRLQPKPEVKALMHPPALSASPPPAQATHHGVVMSGAVIGTRNSNTNVRTSNLNIVAAGSGGGGGFRLQPTVESASLVSLADTPDDIYIPSSPPSSGNDRLDSVSPVFNGLASGTASRPSSSCMVGAPRNGRVDQANNNGLATFFNQPRECANCKSPAVAFACEVCEDFFLCEDCRFNVDVVRAIHDPTHAMLSIQDNHCSSSRTFGGDSIFSLSGDGGASSLFNPPCTRCGRVIDDTEAVYRCEQCDYVLCQECFFKPPEPVVAAESDSPHEHVLKRFQRKSKSASIHEGAVVSKTRNSGGNRVINDYVVVRLLGRGSYAKVKLVQHIRTQELFALKILKKQKKTSNSGANLGRSRVKLANAGVSEDDLLREIAVMKFIDHPNITKLKEVIEDVEAQKVYVIMEYCENGPVHVLDDPPLELERVRQYGADIMRGLLHLHSEFLYHRDIKPANCLVNYENVVKIADFGTCNSQIRTKSSEGTLAFSCPEQVRGEEVSGEVVDSWAFALTLYEMAYGTLPVSTTSLLQHRNMLLGEGPIPIPATGDPQLRDLLAGMLNKKLKDRTLLSAAARHPFFAIYHLDPHGAPYNAAQLSSTKQLLLQQQQQKSQSQSQLSASSPTSRGAVSPRGEQQQKQQQEEALTELYDKALESVHRGKNLKDCFHGVRALRRIRRKEAETARHTSEAATLTTTATATMHTVGGGGGTGAPAAGQNVHGTATPGALGSGGEEEDMAYFFDDEDDNDSAPRSPNDSQNGGAAGLTGPAMNSSTGSREEEEAAAAAATAVEEIVQHHVATREPKVEVTYVNLTRPATLEKLNALAKTVTELRMGHNGLLSTCGLHFPAFSMLKEISIAFNRLDAFPEDVLLVPRLVRLDLSHNRIPSIPPTLVTRAPFLERLNLHHNFITHVGTVAIHSTTPDLPSTSASALLSAPAAGAAGNGAKAMTGWLTSAADGTTTRTTSTTTTTTTTTTLSAAAHTPKRNSNNTSRTNPADMTEMPRAPHRLDAKVVSVLAAPCLRHVRLSGNPLEALPLALETTNRLELVLDAIPALMEQWQMYTQQAAAAATKNGTGAAAASAAALGGASAEADAAAPGVGRATKSTTTPATSLSAAAAAATRDGNNRAGSAPSTKAKTSLVAAAPAAALSSQPQQQQLQQQQQQQLTPPPAPFKAKLPAVIVWDDSFPVRIPDVEPAVWLAVNNMAVYRVQTLRTCRTRRVVLCQCADPRFPNGAFDSADLEAYFAELTKALQEHRQERQLQQQQQQQQPQLNGSFDMPGPSSDAMSGALPPIVGRAARSYVESYFFVTDDESEEDGGYHNLVEYLNDALAAKEPVLVVVMTSGNTSAVRTHIVAALSTCLTLLRGTDPDDISEQAELVVSTMRSLYA